MAPDGQPPSLPLSGVEAGWLQLQRDRQQFINTPIHHGPLMTNVCITAHSTPEPFSYSFHFVKQVHLPTLRMIPIFLHCLNTPYQPHMQNFRHFLWVTHFLDFFSSWNDCKTATSDKSCHIFSKCLKLGMYPLNGINKWPPKFGIVLSWSKNHLSKKRVPD